MSDSEFWRLMARNFTAEEFILFAKLAWMGTGKPGTGLEDTAKWEEVRRQC
jgi:hypothetical protein